MRQLTFLAFSSRVGALCESIWIGEEAGWLPGNLGSLKLDIPS